MAASDKPVRSTLLAQCRRQLADPLGRWWTDAQLNSYIDDWQDGLNRHYEWVHSTATILATSSSVNLPADCGRVVYVLHNNESIPVTNEPVLGEIDPCWRTLTGSNISAYLQYNSTSLTPWPILLATNTLEIGYVKLLTLATDTSQIEIPAFTKWSCVPYVCQQAYTVLGPTFDLQRAMRYKARFKRWQTMFMSAANLLWGSRAPRLRHGNRREVQLVRPVQSSREVS